MNENERINEIMNILYQKNTINNVELEEIFNASPVTIRRDLEKLRKRGLIVRYRGGAMLAKSKFGHEPSLGEREDEFLPEKRAIGMAAAEMIEKGEGIGKSDSQQRKYYGVYPEYTNCNCFLSYECEGLHGGGILESKRNESGWSHCSECDTPVSFR